MRLEAGGPEWLGELWWRDAWFEMEALEGATLPPWLGSTVRGALGHLLRPALCDLPRRCGHDCRAPEVCRYYSLFEKKQQGERPFVLMAPPMPGLETIAMGGPVELPYRTGGSNGGDRLERMRCEGGWKLDAGARLRFGLRLAGPASESLAGIIGAVARFGLSLGGARFRLAEARDAAGRILYDSRFPEVPVQRPEVCRFTAQPEKAPRVRVVFLSPTVLKVDTSVTFAPHELAGRFFENCLSAAVKMYQTCCGERLPWVDASWGEVALAGSRLFRYELPRHSFRQEKWLNFDGVVGYMDLRGTFDAAIPYARVAEVFGFGQKASFGQGAVRVFILDQVTR